MKTITDEKLIDEILSRGAEDIIDKKSLKEKLMSGRQLNIKFGIDPTGPKIHLGRATVLIKLRDFQNLGHKVTLIIGDFTALIGDASDKTAIRQPLTEAEIKSNLKDYLAQIGMVLDMKKTEVRHNKEWLGKMKAGELVRLCMNFTAQQMIQRRNFKERWDGEKPIGLHELLYPIFQGYDSVAIKSDLELGGFDQLFNLKAGRELQKTFGQQPQDIMTLRMIYGLDGRKMSTSWGNGIFITDDPKDMYGKLMTLKDELIIDYFESCTRVPLDMIEGYKSSLEKKTANPKEIKKILAREIIKYFHGEKKAEAAEKEFEQVFEDKQLPTEIQEVEMSEGEIGCQELLTEIGIAKSKGEARRLIEQGGVRIIFNGNSEIIKDWKGSAPVKKGMIIQSGKRNFRKII
jgi:tyrosyl-tRNA synthetase